MDAVKRPKIGDRVGNNICRSGKSYQCGKTCISNSWNCRKGVKDVNDARRIASILASTNERLKASIKVSDKAQARGEALFEARRNRAKNPKMERDINKNAKSPLAKLLGTDKQIEYAEQKREKAISTLQELKDIFNGKKDKSMVGSIVVKNALRMLGKEKINEAIQKLENEITGIQKASTFLDKPIHELRWQGNRLNVFLSAK